MDICVSSCMVSIDSFRTVLIFSIVGSLPFKESNLFYNFILKGVTDIFNTLRSNLSGFCFWNSFRN